MVTTVDKRKQPLVFKSVIYELRSDLLLVEFRRTKVTKCNTMFMSVVFLQGDGLEFKRIFRKVREHLSDIICRAPAL